MKGIKALYKTNLLSFKGIWYLLKAIQIVGINLMTLLYVRQKLSPHRIAFRDNQISVSYHDLYLKSQHLADQLSHHYHVKKHQKIAIIAYNHLTLLYVLFAVSVLGADIYLLNAEISEEQFKDLNKKYQFDLIIHDPEISFLSQENTLLTEHPDLLSIHTLLDYPFCYETHIRKPQFFSKIIVLTSGSTGHFKVAQRKTKTTNFLMPFYQLLVQLNLFQYRSIYIATPIYHGFGIATLCMSVILGATSYMTRKFVAVDACDLIKKNHVEVVTLVPLMLHRMLKYDVTKLSSLQCIITGGAPIAEALVIQVATQLGNILFNLYGTSEAGICTIATPEDLARYPTTIGKPITGLRVRLGGGSVSCHNMGELFVKCAWSTQRNAWLSTGDIASVDGDGYYYLHGRVDDMIISGGENVYPVSIEKALFAHPMVEQVYITSIQDIEFGQRLVAFVVMKQEQITSSEALFAWLQTQIPRYQTPKKLLIVPEIPITQIGKPDKHKLLQLV